MLRKLIVAVALGVLHSTLALAETAKLEGVVNLNTATPEELRLIPGVGPARIRNILAYRRAHPFRTVDELARIKGIGRKTVRRWRAHLATSGPSTAQRVTRPELAFVGPPPIEPRPSSPPPSAQVARRPAPAAAPPRVRKGEPAHGAFPRAPGVGCLPPP